MALVETGRRGRTGRADALAGYASWDERYLLKIELYPGTWAAVSYLVAYHTEEPVKTEETTWGAIKSRYG
jgi:hypothetical protein